MLKYLRTTLSSLGTVLALAVAMSWSVLAHDAACNVTSSVFNGHIKPLHCDLAGFPGKSKFLPVWCTNVAAAQGFCTKVQTNPHTQRTVQGDSRIRYDSPDLGLVVGTNGERCGRVIIKGTADGTVVTQFPQQC